jgi:lipoprotein-releasing system permease protein
VVRNINEIHDWLGSAFGLVIWDPSVYYFSEIPSEVDPMKAVFVAVAGVLTCVIGAAIPSIRAAKMDPVRALRFE